MNQFPTRHNLLKLMQGERDNMNKPVAIREIGSLIKSLSKKKVPSLDVFTNEFYQMFKEEMIPILPNIF